MNKRGVIDLSVQEHRAGETVLPGGASVFWNNSKQTGTRGFLPFFWGLCFPLPALPTSASGRPLPAPDLHCLLRLGEPHQGGPSQTWSRLGQGLYSWILEHFSFHLLLGGRVCQQGYSRAFSGFSSCSNKDTRTERKKSRQSLNSKHQDFFFRFRSSQ